jgi:hypothetical protein
MQAVGTRYSIKLQQLNKKPIYVVTFAGIPMRFSTDVLQNPIGPYNDLVGNITGSGSQTTIIEGKTCISTFSFDIEDQNLVMTKLLFTYPFPNRQATVTMGFAGMNENEFIKIFVGYIIDYTLKDDNVTWAFQLNDQSVRPTQYIFNAFTETMAAVNPGDSVIAVATVGAFAPASGIKDYIVIDDEIISYTSVTPGTATTPAYFNGCLRGLFGTTDTSHDNGVQVNNYIVLQDNPINIALKIMLSTGQGTNGPYDVYTQAQGLGIPQAQIDVAAFEACRDIWLGSYIFQFEFNGQETASSFLESEIYQFTGSYTFINANGQLALHTYSGPYGNAQFPVLNDDNIVGSPKWKGNLLKNYFFNEFDISYDYDILSDQYESEELYENATSQIKYFNLVECLTLQSRGIRSVVTGQTIIDRIINRIMNRFGDPTPIVTVKTFLSQRLIEIGDIVNLTSAKLPDIARGAAGVKNVLMEVIAAVPNYQEGSVTFDLLNTQFSYNKKYGAISPSAQPPVNFPQFQNATTSEKLYCFISELVTPTLGKMLDGTDGYYITG